MKKMISIEIVLISIAILMWVLTPAVYGASDAFKDNIYKVGALKPLDSKLKVKVGDRAPEFTLPSVSGEKVSMGQYRGKKNVVLSFVPAAWTPVCSDQWPGYNLIRDVF